MGIAVTAAIAVLVLRASQPAYALVLSLTAGVALLAFMVSQAGPLLERIEELMNGVLPDSSYAEVLLKALGIAILTQSAADICRDAGESSLAGKTELCGNVLILLCGLPLYEHAFSLLEGIINGREVVL